MLQEGFKDALFLRVGFRGILEIHEFPIPQRKFPEQYARHRVNAAVDHTVVCVVKLQLRAETVGEFFPQLLLRLVFTQGEIAVAQPAVAALVVPGVAVHAAVNVLAGENVPDLRKLVG